MQRAFESCWKLTDEHGRAVRFPGVFWKEQTTGPLRLACAPSGSCVRLVRALASTLDGPLLLLFVLRVSRRGRTPGRYQSPLLSNQEVDEFLVEFGEFFDRDARQCLWIGQPNKPGLIVWDSHQWLYGYGPLERMLEIAKSFDLTEGRAELPVPHCHNYHLVFDDLEEEVLDRFAWVRTPLLDGDDEM